MIERSQFEEAIAFADLMHFDKELVYKKQIHLLLREWKDVKNANWLEDPAVDCTSLFELIRKTQPSLILYACETEWIPSRATMERILLFGMDDLVQMDGYEEEKMNFLLVYLKWKVFVRGLSHVESATCSLWLVRILVAFLLAISSFISLSNTRPSSFSWRNSTCSLFVGRI